MIDQWIKGFWFTVGSLCAVGSFGLALASIYIVVGSLIWR